MIHAEWMLNLQSGPVVGEAECKHVTEAWETVKRAFREAFAESWGPEHAEGLARLEQLVMWESRDALEAAGRWNYRSAGVSVTLTRHD